MAAKLSIESTATVYRDSQPLFFLSAAQFPARLLSMLALLADKHDGSPIDSYAHSLQSATLAYEDDADDETVFIALFHDIGQLVSEQNHSEVSGAILKPFVSESAHWVVKHHAELMSNLVFRH